MAKFFTASDDEIKNARTTDVYFTRTKRILEEKGLSKISVVAEITPSPLPREWPWGILCGIEEATLLLEGLPINVYSMPEGSIFYPYDARGIREPVLFIEGPYGDFCVYETPLLGLLCQSTGIATMAARLRKMAGNVTLVSFGIRRMHPALAPMIDRAAYMGGFDAVSSLMGAKTIGKEPVGTMPHALIIVFGEQVSAWKAFDEVIEPEVPRIALVDTYSDEKEETLMAANALKEKLHAVRLDTPGSRRGDFAELIREVRWELNVRGYQHVKIFVSGGISDKNIGELVEAGADGFGVGTSLSNAPTVDFALDVVEKEGKPVAKRGKLGGKKQVWRCESCLLDFVQLAQAPRPKCSKCGADTTPMLKMLLKDGKLVGKLPSVDEIRSYVLEQLAKLPPL
jgi:nicotinate phosphoribosyltransferase